MSPIRWCIGRPEGRYRAIYGDVHMPSASFQQILRTRPRIFTHALPRIGRTRRRTEQGPDGHRQQGHPRPCDIRGRERACHQQGRQRARQGPGASRHKLLSFRCGEERSEGDGEASAVHSRQRGDLHVRPFVVCDGHQPLRRRQGGPRRGPGCPEQIRGVPWTTARSS